MYNGSQLNKSVMDEATQAIADELIASAKAEQQARRSAKRAVRFLKILTSLLVVAAILWIIKPYILGNDIRDRVRQNNARAIADEISAYKSRHRNSLPMETSRRQWNRELIDMYIKGKDFAKDPHSQEEYRFEVNYQKPASELLNQAGYDVVYIDQSRACGENGELINAGSSIAAVRLKLESGQLYCTNSN